METRNINEIKEGIIQTIVNQNQEELITHDYLRRGIEKTVESMTNTRSKVLSILLEKTGLKIKYLGRQRNDLSHRNYAPGGYYTRYQHTIYWDFFDKTTLIHEMSHAIDAVLNYVTTEHKNSNDKTLFETIKEELIKNFKPSLNDIFDLIEESHTSKNEKSQFDLLKPYLLKPFFRYHLT